MTTAPATADVVRRIMSHPDVRDVDVAEREGIPLTTVRAVRIERKRNALDGTRYAAPRPGRPAKTRRARTARFDFDAFMRSNDGVCP